MIRALFRYSRRKRRSYDWIPLHMEGFHYSIDSLKWQRGRLYGFGWALHQTRRINEVHVLIGSFTEPRKIKVYYGTERSDVANDFPFQGAKDSGFWFSCKARKEELPTIRLEIYFENGELNILPMDAVQGNNLSSVSAVSWAKMKKAVNYLMRGDFKRLWNKAVSIFRDSLACYNRTSRIMNFLMHVGVQPGHPFLLVIDHNMGGGANLYREEYVQKESLIRPVIVIKYDLSNLHYGITVVYNGKRHSNVIEPIDLLLKLPNYIDIGEIIINNLVSFDDPMSFIKLILELKRRTSSVLTIPIHDFFSGCPSFYLLNETGDFCGIPDINICRMCLPKNHGDFRLLVDHENIDTWRKTWSQCLFQADSILCFSQSTVELLKRIYPELPDSKLKLNPHKVDYLEDIKPKLNQAGDLHIGVVGSISEQKGAGIVRKLVHLIEEKGLAVRVTVIGTLAQIPDSPLLSVTGAYHRNELSDLIEKSGVNICLVPSIWPETFCYVVQELIQFQVPVAVFGLGAQSERVSKYHRGLVISELDAENALSALLNFHEKIKDQI